MRYVKTAILAAAAAITLVCAPMAQAQDTLKLRFQARDLGSIDPALT